MNNNKTSLEKAVKQAAASLWLDNIPLSKEYVATYYKRRRIQRLKNGPKLTLKRSGISGKYFKISRRI